MGVAIVDGATGLWKERARHRCRLQARHEPPRCCKVAALAQQVYPSVDLIEFFANLGCIVGPHTASIHAPSRLSSRLFSGTTGPSINVGSLATPALTLARMTCRYFMLAALASPLRLSTDAARCWPVLHS